MERTHHNVVLSVRRNHAHPAIRVVEIGIRHPAYPDVGRCMVDAVDLKLVVSPPFWVCSLSECWDRECRACRASG